eukprot:10336-Heterococcus_DN1.PRE.2
MFGLIGSIACKIASPIAYLFTAAPTAAAAESKPEISTSACDAAPTAPVTPVDSADTVRTFDINSVSDEQLAAATSSFVDTELLNISSEDATAAGHEQHISTTRAAATAGALTALAQPATASATPSRLPQQSLQHRSALPLSSLVLHASPARSLASSPAALHQSAL